MQPDDEILQSWRANAGNWVKTIDGNEIESRTAVTNEAIVNTIVCYSPASILDIGCGEGWLTRTLQSKGIAAYGVDAVEELIENAIEKGRNHYSVCSYNDLLSGVLNLGGFGAAVFNFSLLDKENTELILKHLAQALPKGSLVFIQTLHPFNIAIEDVYVTGWKEGSWKGLKQEFVNPYQWYFRTFENWIQLFAQAGYRLQQLSEPLHPSTQKPASVIFVIQN